MAKVGIIGGSGLYEIEGMENVQEVTIVDTPFGPPSDVIVEANWEGTPVAILNRHGRGHTLGR